MSRGLLKVQAFIVPIMRNGLSYGSAMKIGWCQKNFDMAFDQNNLSVDQEMGNKGLGGIAAILCCIAICIPSFFTILQMAHGTATGNPFGALVCLFLILGWPLYWGVSQFFLRRIISLRGDSLKFICISPFRIREAIVPFREFEAISIGRTRSRSTADNDHSIGYTGVYYVRLIHKDKRYATDLYNAVQKQMNQERIQKYTRMFAVPIENHMS